jgi:5-methylcytosine-specific restriction endonuclease McrA
MAKLRRDADGPLDDDGALLLMARHVLGGPSDEGRSNYQIAMTVCEECGRAWQQGRGELVEVGPEIAEMVACDAQHIGHVTTSEPSSSAHVGAKSTRPAVKPARAEQDIPPRIRREVLRRDHGRCVVPGCTHATFVDLHHLQLRSEGGAHNADKIITLCAAHHRAQHRGQLVIEGTVSTGLTFRHADGTLYGRAMSAQAVDVHRKVFSALRGMGFREGEAKRALECVRTDVHVGASASAAEILRAAIGILT